MLKRTGILLCCLLGLAACSSEMTDEDSGDDYSDAAQGAAEDSPTATIVLDGETFDVSGEGYCQRVGSRSTDGSKGILRIVIEASDNDILENNMLLQILRGEVRGLSVNFNKYVYGWIGIFSPEEDPSEFDGRRFTFEGTVLGTPDEERATTIRVDIDCPFVEDLTTE